MQDPKEIIHIKETYKMIVYVDIDDTICECPKTDLPDYSKCVPYPKRIAKINRLYDEGNYILYWTARGTISGIDWTDLTVSQLKGWGCKYHKLVLKKPSYDLFIDDKNINSDDYFQNC